MTKNGFLTEKEATRAKDKAVADVERGLRISASVPNPDRLRRELAGRVGPRKLDRHRIPAPAAPACPPPHRATAAGQGRSDDAGKPYADPAVEPAPSLSTRGWWSEPKPLGLELIDKIAVTMGRGPGCGRSDRPIATNPALMTKTTRPQPRRPQGREAGDERLDGAAAGGVSAPAARTRNDSGEYPFAEALRRQRRLAGRTGPGASGGQMSISRPRGCISAARWTSRIPTPAPPSLRRTASRGRWL